MTDTGQEWFNPLNKVRIQNAVKSKAPKVVLTNGLVLALNYHKHQGRVHFSPIPSPQNRQPFVPRGTWSIEKVLDDEWFS